MSLNMKTLTQALAKTAAVIEKTVQTTVQEVTGPKPLQDYEIIDQIGSAGPGLAWKLYSAKVRDPTRAQQYPIVCVWVLDKRALSEARVRAGLSKAVEDAFLDLARADAGRLVRLRHPGVVHVVQAMDESKNAMAMVTEPLFASVANALGNLENFENVMKVPKELKGLEMSLLEMKHGLLQIAESLDFLHSNAHLIHRAISPECGRDGNCGKESYNSYHTSGHGDGMGSNCGGNVLITSSGAWKLGGFGFAITTDQASSDSSNVQAFHYAEYDVEDSMLPLQPSLNYTAPELVRSKTASVGCFSDIFSFGCLAYHLIARKPLFDCHNNVKMYMNTLTYLSNEAFSSIPPELVPDLQRMLSANESLRPTASDFTGSPFFRDDTRLRALRFLDHMLGRDNMQKSEFLKALSDMWKDFDSRVLRYKLMDHSSFYFATIMMHRNFPEQDFRAGSTTTLCRTSECSDATNDSAHGSHNSRVSVGLCKTGHPNRFRPKNRVSECLGTPKKDRNDFELITLPALLPVLTTAAGETLLLLVKQLELISNKEWKWFDNNVFW
ncbi:hypothetical protein Pint_07044 [Pistacia integerrima]|uniref:Uncharacterized protein n=1 Tax=Pistacia integerrima TaxID=434235 RepID=A0ACC0XV66_9ROSI|nr:hypothetical protein Pint_07044 [Pistacia integerrima]